MVLKVTRAIDLATLQTAQQSGLRDLYRIMRDVTKMSDKRFGKDIIATEARVVA